jgi:DnaA-like protein
MVAHPGQVHDGVPGSTATADHLALESALRAAVAERLGELRFGLWFGEEVHLGLSGDGDALEVQVPNAFFREWIRGHFSTSLVEAAQVVTGRQVRLNFAIQNEIDPPPGDVVDPDADRSQQRSGSTVTVPIPGNPKTPLSFPAPHPPRSLSENSICALRLGEIGKVYGRKTLAIHPILSIQMLFSDRLLGWLTGP